MKFKRTASDCAHCPLQHMNRVWGQSGIEKAQVILLGEAPGAEEDEKKEPFVGAAGARLKGVIATSGLFWHTVHRTNVICCRPPNNNIDSDEAIEAIKCCTPGFLQELEYLKKNGAKVIMPLGNTALRALGIEGNIGKVRGSVYETNRLIAVPTYHPSFILRGAWKEEPTWGADFVKAKDLSLKGWKRPKEKFNIYPTVTDVEEFVEKAIKTQHLIGVDIETTSLNPYYSKILMIGLGWDKETALVVPFYKQGLEPYWSPVDYKKVFNLVDKLLRNCPTMFQNAAFDVKHLEAHGFHVGNIAEDTMLAHHCIHPELPHNLEYIVSVYGETPAWKAAVKTSVKDLSKTDDREARTYNARDSVVMAQIIGELHKDLNELDTMKVYRRFSMRLLRSTIAMSQRGMLIDKRRLDKASRKFKKDTEKYLGELRELLDVPDGFNFESSYHLQTLVYGKYPATLVKWQADLGEYTKPGNKLNKNTKKYKELRDKVYLYEAIAPLRLPPGLNVRSTKTGLALDDEAFLTIQRKCLSRLDGMDAMVRRNTEWEREQGGLKRTLKFLELYRKYSTASKLASTYSGYPLGPDGRVHPEYKIHGTATGRLSASAPNLQNQPAVVQDVFVAPPGYVIIKADYSNIELRMLAYITQEPVLIETFAKGINVHDVNTKILFGIDEKHPNWKNIRRAAKVYVFGRSYGGGVMGIYNQIITEVPDIELTLQHFKEADQRYFEKLGKYREWRDKITKQARETRIVETISGRKRILLGTPDEIERQALNTPIQGSAGEVAEEAICDLYDEFQKPSKKAWDAAMVLTVHDSILTEVREEYAMQCAKMMKKVMEKEWVINGMKVHFPVDIEIGPSWGETKKVEV